MKKRSKFQMLVVVLLALALLLPAFAAQASYRRGDNNQEIIALQTVLAGKGYFKDTANGIFGPATEKAVKAYQKANGLTQDGIAGPATLAKLGLHSDAPVQSAATVSHQSGTLCLRTGPSTSHSALVELKNGTEVSVLSQTGSWCKIRLSGGLEGYVSSKGLKGVNQAASTEGTVRVTTSLNVRASASTSAKVLTTLKNGAKVNILASEGANWLKIKTNSVTGYVNSNYIVSGSAAALRAPSASLRRGDESADVVTLQQRLKDLGYFTANTTGYYGTITVASVKAFQKAAGLKQDGVAGKDTLAALFSENAPAKASGPSEQSDATKEKIERLIEYARQYLGVKYVMGGNGPNTFDCSGFTKYVYKEFGYTLQRSAYQQGYGDYGTKITSLSNLKPGDLVFFNTLPDNDLSDHVGIYIGNNQFIHAGGSKVNIADITSNYWKNVFSWARRVF